MNQIKYKTNFSEEVLKNGDRSGWTADQLIEVTGGRWHVPPPKEWFARSVVAGRSHVNLVEGPVLFAAHTHMDRARHEQFGNMENVHANNWDLHDVVPKISEKICGAIVSHFIEGLSLSVPQLIMNDPFKAIIELGIANRMRIKAPVIGVTGSSGKTSTVHMMNKVFGSFLRSYSTYDNYNSRGGMLVVLASAPVDAEIIPLEVAISAINSSGFRHIKIVKPDLAVITNIGPSHMLPGQTTHDVARRKANIFEGMEPGANALICSDTEHYEYLVDRANSYGLKVHSYGEKSWANIRLETYDHETGKVSVSYPGGEVSYHLAARGKHMAINSLACIGVALCCNLDLKAVAKGFAAFESVSGRGDIHRLKIGGAEVKIIDESYNANPLSMRAAIDLVKNQACVVGGRRILVLGSMLELGEHEQKYHLELADAIKDARPDKVILVGSLMSELSSVLAKSGLDVEFLTGVNGLKEILSDGACAGDLMLFKASNGIGLHKVVKSLISEFSGLC